MNTRIRYEVLRRDSYRCQLCGATAQDGTTVLEVDHIIPKALGGDDLAGNLQTLCRDCNRGKGSAAPDSGELDAVAERQAARRAVRDAAMDQWDADLEEARARMTRSYPWNPIVGDDASMMKFRSWGASWELIDHALDVTAIKFERTPSYRRDRLPDPMAYTTGIVRNLLSNFEDRAR